MTTNREQGENPPEWPHQVLFELELRIARRADQLIAMARLVPARSLECWLGAEREIFAEMLFPETSHVADRERPGG